MVFHPTSRRRKRKYIYRAQQCWNADYSMKLLRYGPPGGERPAVLHDSGRLRDLSRLIPDIARGQLLPECHKFISNLDRDSLPLIEGEPRIGPCVGSVGKTVGVGSPRARLPSRFYPIPLAFGYLTCAKIRRGFLPESQAWRSARGNHIAGLRRHKLADVDLAPRYYRPRRSATADRSFDGAAFVRLGIEPSIKCDG
jgi:hypothetical protein